MAKENEKIAANIFEDPSNPFYLHHSDQPGLILVTQTLTQENYPVWSHAMLMALTTKNKDGFIDGTVTKPVSGSAGEIKQWTRCNLLVKGWILNTISPNIAQSVMYNDSAFALWNELRERFSQTNSVHLFHVDQEIQYCVQEGLNIGEYYTKLKSLWDKRDALCPLPPCDGDTARKLQEYQQTQQTIKFLMGLDGAYATARGQILLIEPLPPVNKVFSLIIQDEKQRVVSSQVIGKAPDAAAFAVKNGPQNQNRNHLSKNAHLRCDRCNITGHSTENCRAHLKCDYCGFKGHTIDFCRKLKRATSHGDKRENSISFSKVHYADSKSDKAETSSSPSSYSLTAEQYHDLLALLDRTKSSTMVNQVSSASTVRNLSGPTFGEDDWDGN